MQSVGSRDGVWFSPMTMGSPMAAEMAHTRPMVNQTRLWFLWRAYLIGWVTAMYLPIKQILINLVPFAPNEPASKRLEANYLSEVGPIN
jgi:hypothetical protein